MKYSLVFLSILMVLNFSCKRKESNLSLVQITAHTDAIYDELVNIRRDLHQYPELAGHEKRTAQIVENYLLDLGLEVKKGFAGHGLVGILNGDKKGKKIAWRADMDAIDLRTMGSIHYPKSKNPGVAHLCGHDVHTTIGLGIAKVLSELKDQIDGTIYFIFQPAEETFLGAKTMVEDSLFHEINPDEIYGLHVFPTEVGTVGTKSDELFAYERKLTVSFDKNLDATDFQSFFKTALELLARHQPKSEPWSLANLVHSELGVESPSTIYTDYFIFNSKIKTFENDESILFEATFFETDADRLASVPTYITDKILNSEFAESYQSTLPLSGNPTVQNHTGLTETCLQTLQNEFGAEHIRPFYGQIPYFNEDFIYFQRKVPGVMFLLGASNQEKGTLAMPHSPEFVVDESAIKYGVTYFSNLLAKRTGSKSTSTSGLHTPWLANASNTNNH